MRSYADPIFGSVRGGADRRPEPSNAGEIAAKTVNNTLGTLVVCLNAAVKDRVIATDVDCIVHDVPSLAAP
jgi:hypothetical protein